MHKVIDLMKHNIDTYVTIQEVSCKVEVVE